MDALSPQSWVDRFRTYFGPTARAFSTLDEQGAREYTQALTELVQLHNRATDGTVDLAGEYVNVVAIKR